MDNAYQFKTLLGHKNLAFSIACLYSLMRNSVDRIELQIFEDGTLTEGDEDELRSCLKRVSVVRKAERDIIVDEKLAHYPCCMRYRRESAYAQKLFDVMLTSESDLKFVDSDVYFIRRYQLPQVGHNPVFIRDSQNAYSFNPSQFMGIRFPIVGRVNTGMFFFPFKYYDLELLEKLLSDLLIRKGYQRLFWLEQTLWAFLAGTVSETYFFDDVQIKMARRDLSVEEQTIAVHLVSSYRFHFDQLSSQPLAQGGSAERIRLLSNTGVLNKYEFAVDRLRRGIYRRIGIFQ